ncbi:carbon storage regulator CsrA [Abyssisolibacter fermentans]|uniref:carbon storage regulator CsrA n=1 Tax=Abyssisolibacter fermentans TaxID=1766203 RepID=UPI0008343D5E|nr:carbon storage regulator CsrA [Abyssisolibacter fermentans]
MLILSRKKEQSIMINKQIEVIVMDIVDGKVKLGIKAPKEIEIYRKEIYEDIKDANKAAAKNNKGNMKTLKEFFERNSKNI